MLSLETELHFQIYLGERTGQGEQKSSLCTFANKASQGFIWMSNSSLSLGNNPYQFTKTTNLVLHYFFLRLSVFKPYVFEPQAICFWTTGLHFEDRVVVSFHLHEPEKNFKDEKHTKKAQLCRWVWRNRCASSSSSYFVLVLNGNGVVFLIVVNVVVVLLTLRIVQNWLFSVQLK